MANSHPVPHGFEAALQEWLRDDIRLEAPRRLARVTAHEMQLSKYEPRFIKELFALLDRFPELFDEDAIVEAYRREAASLPADTSRIEA